MAGSFEVDGDDVIITFTFSPTIEKGQNIVDFISRQLYVETIENPWSDLTNQEKVNIIDKEIKRHLLDLARIERRSFILGNNSDQSPIDL
jgi:hypothetical protein